MLSEPEALVAFLGSLGLAFARIGLEAGPLSQCLHAGLERAGLPVVLIETRHVKAALSAMTIKAYLADVFSRLVNRHPASQIDQLMPWAYANPVA